MDVAELVRQFISTLKWPVVVLLLVVLLIWYRRQVADWVQQLLQRTEALEISPSGARATFRQPSDGEPTDPANPEQPPITDEQAPESLRLIEKLAEERLNMQHDYDALATEYSTARLHLFFEQVFRFIFGSQLEMLYALHATDPIAGLARIDLERYYLTWRGLSQGTGPVAASWTFEDYIAFPLRNQLIESVGDGADSYRLGRYGLAFLEYVSIMALPVGERPF